jgi:uncharacterized caspase-like protein
MPRSKLSFLILAVAAVLFAGVARLPAQQWSATPESLQKALEPAPPANVVISPSNNSQVAAPVIPAPVSASNNSQLAGPQARADFSNLNQTYERTLAKAQEECNTLWSSHTFDWLRKKIPLGDEKPTLSMLTSKDRLHPKDKPRADLAIKTLEQCRQAYAPLYAMLPARDMISGLERRQDAVIAELYVGKITFGEFNVKWSKLRGEHMSALSGVPQTTPSPASSSVPVKTTAPSPGPLSVPPPAQSAKTIPVATQPTRIALVIGNSNYTNLPKLSNPANDARSISDGLKQIGFITKLILDASEQDMRREIRKFANASSKAGIALVFYAGHGAQVNGDNYLLPVDMEIAHTEVDIQLTGLKVDDLVNSIGSNTKIVFLDACRDNPALFKNLVHGRSAARAVGLAPTVGSNLDQVKPGGGVFIAYATESGSVAEDGQAKHSPFTQALLRNLQKPISIDDMFSFVTKEVRLTTKNKQRPYKYASLENIVCLTDNCVAGASGSATVTDPVQQAQHSEAEDLQIALQANNPDALDAYLQKYPNSPRRGELLETISTLKRSEFDEWTLFEVSNKQFPWFMKINSVVQFGDRVAVRVRSVADPSKSLGERHFPDAAYLEQVAVYDCTQPITAIAEVTIFNKSGETLHHYKWADPLYLNLAIGVTVTPGSINASTRNIVCHNDLRTPLFSKDQLAAMKFTSVSSTRTGDGDIFYAPIQHNINAHDDLKEFAGIIQYHDDVLLTVPNIDFPGFPKYRTQVDHIKIRCSNNTMVTAKSEYFDALKKLVYLNAVDPMIIDKMWTPLNPGSPISRVVCANEAFGGIGVEVAMDGTFIKVVRVIEEAPAQKAGVTVNDVITHLNDKPVDGLTLNQVVEKLRGSPNTTIKLRITREGNDVPVELAVTRGVVQRPSVPLPSVQAPSVQLPSVQGQVQQ